MIDHAIQAEAITVRFDTLLAIRNVSVSVRPGERVALVGVNGSGKSVLMSALAGLVPVECGNIELFGEDITRSSIKYRLKAGLCLLPTSGGVFRSLSIAENLRVATSVLSDATERPTSVEWALDMFPELRTNLRAKAGSLSGGQQRLLGLVSAIIKRPRVLLADEPTHGLSPRAAERVMQCLLETDQREQQTVMWVDHNLDQAIELSDRVIVMFGGEIVHVSTAPRRDPEVRDAFLGMPERQKRSPE